MHTGNETQKLNERMKCIDKRYSKIDQHLARHFKYHSGCLSSPQNVSISGKYKEGCAHETSKLTA